MKVWIVLRGVDEKWPEIIGTYDTFLTAQGVAERYEEDTYISSSIIMTEWEAK